MVARQNGNGGTTKNLLRTTLGTNRSNTNKTQQHSRPEVDLALRQVVAVLVAAGVVGAEAVLAGAEAAAEAVLVGAEAVLVGAEAVLVGAEGAEAVLGGAEVVLVVEAVFVEEVVLVAVGAVLAGEEVALVQAEGEGEEDSMQVGVVRVLAGLERAREMRSIDHWTTWLSASELQVPRMAAEVRRVQHQ
jgi:hypothetical protein